MIRALGVRRSSAIPSAQVRFRGLALGVGRLGVHARDARDQQRKGSQDDPNGAREEGCTESKVLCDHLADEGPQGEAEQHHRLH